MNNTQTTVAFNCQKRGYKNIGLQSTGQSRAFMGTNPDNPRILHVRNLDTDIGHHEVFEHFCTFGNLKRVTLRQRNEHFKFATVLYTSKESVKLALAANPHNFRGRLYYCHKAGAMPKANINKNRRSPKNQINCYQRRLASCISLRQYIYHSKPDSFKTKQNGGSLSLLPKASLALLHYLRENQEPLIENSPKISFISLLNNVGQNFNFVRHSYTNFAANQKQPGQYEEIPTEAKIRLTAIDYADLRDRQDLISFHYAADYS